MGGYAGQLSAGPRRLRRRRRLHLRHAVGGARASRRGSACSSAALLSAVLGAVIGFLGFRFGLRGFYFVLLTVAFAEICRIVALNTDAVGGALGLYITFTGNPRQFQFQDNRVVLLHRARPHARGHRARGRGSSAGASASTSPRSARTRAPARRSASNTFKYKMLAMVLSSFLTGRRRDLLRLLPLLAPARTPCSASRCRSRSSSGPSWAARAPCWGRSSARSS